MVQCNISADDKSLYLFHSYENDDEGNDKLCKESRLNVRLSECTMTDTPCLTIDYRTFRFNGLGYADQEQSIHCTLALDNSEIITLDTVIDDCACKNEADCARLVPTIELSMSGSQELSEVTWNDDLNDSESDLFKQTAESFATDMETLLKSSDDVVDATVTVQSFSQTSESDDSYGGKRRRRSEDEEDQKICASATYAADLILAEEKSANDMDTTLTTFLENVDLGQFADMTFTDVTCCDLVSVNTRSDESILKPVSTKASTQAPTQAPTQVPTQAPTHASTQTSTQAPTYAPTQAPAQASTEAPTPASTQTPTQSTEADTQAPGVPDPQPNSIFKERLDLINIGNFFEMWSGSLENNLRS